MNVSVTDVADRSSTTAPPACRFKQPPVPDPALPLAAPGSLFEIGR
jgi:hypothetical protein